MEGFAAFTQMPEASSVKKQPHSKKSNGDAVLQAKIKQQKKTNPEFDIAAIAEQSVELPKKYKRNGVMAFQTLTAAEQMAAALSQNDIGITYTVEIDEKHGLAIVVANSPIRASVPETAQYNIPKKDLKRAIDGFEHELIQDSDWSENDSDWSENSGEYQALFQKKEEQFGFPIRAVPYQKKENFKGADDGKVMYLVFPAEPFLDRDKKPISIGDELYHYRYGRCKVTDYNYHCCYDSYYDNVVVPCLKVDYKNKDNNYFSVYPGKNTEFKHTLWKKWESKLEQFEWPDTSQIIMCIFIVAILIMFILTKSLSLTMSAAPSAIESTVTESKAIQVQVVDYDLLTGRVQLMDESGEVMTFKAPKVMAENTYIEVVLRTFDDGNTYVYYEGEKIERVE